MIVVRVTGELARPAAIDGPLHLDALLSARHPAMHGADETLTRSGGRVRIAPLPLAVARSGQDWVWAASAWAPPRADAAAAIVKRRDGVDYRRALRPVYPAVGPDRDRLVRFALTSGPLEFVAVVPDQKALKELRRLLRRVHQVGGKRKSGYGIVREWTVTEIEADPSLALCLDGISSRTLPASMWAAHSSPQALAVHPPYWSHETRPAFPAGESGSLCTITITSPDLRH